MTMKGKVLWHVTMSRDGFIASPNHTMDWMSGLTVTPGIVDEMVATTGTILAGRRGYDAGYNQGPEANRKPYGGAWNGPIFVLTHHPEDAPPHPDFTFLNCDIAEAVETGLAAAGVCDPLEGLGMCDESRRYPASSGATTESRMPTPFSITYAGWATRREHRHRCQPHAGLELAFTGQRFPRSMRTCQALHHPPVGGQLLRRPGQGSAALRYGISQALLDASSVRLIVRHTPPRYAVPGSDVAGIGSGTRRTGSAAMIATTRSTP